MRRVVVGTVVFWVLACSGGGPRELDKPAFTVSCKELEAAGESTFDSTYKGKTIRITGEISREISTGTFDLQGAKSQCSLKPATGEKSSDLKKGTSTTWQCQGEKWVIGPRLNYCRRVTAENSGGAEDKPAPAPKEKPGGGGKRGKKR